MPHRQGEATKGSLVWRLGPSTPNPEERANLAAYIDGELTENDGRAIATKLSSSSIARREVESSEEDLGTCRVSSSAQGVIGIL